MPSQKLPLFGGIAAPVHNGNQGTPSIAVIPLTIFTPPDKALRPRGLQGYYELHLWLKPGAIESEIYTLKARPDDGGAEQIIWIGSLSGTFGGAENFFPQKILDGYPVRGNVTLFLEVDTDEESGSDKYPEGVQVWGYYYRIGQGTQIQPERRFIGADSPDSDGITQGIPRAIALETETPIHYLQQNRIDEISLAFATPHAAESGINVNILFKDVNDNDIIAGQRVILTVPNYIATQLRDPQSVYSIYQIPFGGGMPLPGLAPLDHISILAEDTDGPLYVHGYYTRR